eukprot:6826173-Alexandrium_andersonii.AAC.1
MYSSSRGHQRRRGRPMSGNPSASAGVANTWHASPPSPRIPGALLRPSGGAAPSAPWQVGRRRQGPQAG